MVLVKSLVVLLAVSAVSCNLATEDVVFHLFTKANPAQSQPLLASQNSIALSTFSITSKTVFTIHTYGETSVNNFNAFVVNAYLTAATSEINVIAVDWSKGGSHYTVGLSNAKHVAEIITQFINILNNSFGYSASNIEIVGVGLGGHIGGIAARNAVTTIPRVVALDPSFVGWTYNPDKLKASDATVVEVLHTTAGIWGYDYPLGTVDFYANGGSQQPGCATNTGCSYDYAYIYFAESITAEVNNGAQFRGTKCESYEEATKLACDGLRNVVFGGSGSKIGISGIYSFRTNISPPFAMD